MIDISGEYSIQRYLINSRHSLIEVLGEAGHIIDGYGGNVICPFHDDTAPSARIQRDDVGERLYCYSEHRSYTAYDAIRRFFPGQEKRMASGIWLAMSEVERSQVLSAVTATKSLTSLPELWTTNAPGWRTYFLSGGCSYLDYAKMLIRLMNEREGVI